MRKEKKKTTNVKNYNINEPAFKIYFKTKFSFIGMLKLKQLNISQNYKGTMIKRKEKPE